MSNNYEKISQYLLFITFFIIFVNLAGCGNTTQNENISKIVSIEITPLLNSISLDSQIQLSATSFDSFGKKQDATKSVEWHSSNEQIFSISNTGKLVALTPGTSTISATFENISSSIDLNVNTASLVELNINPANPNIHENTQVKLDVFGLYDDGSKLNLTNSIKWNRQPNSIFSRENNQFIGRNKGKEVISASFNGIAASTIISVNDATIENILLDLSSDTFYLGNRIDLRAIGVFSDGKKQDISRIVNWSYSFSKEKAIIREKNTLIANAVGQLVVNATFGNKSKSQVITISPATLQSLEIISPQIKTTIGSKLKLKTFGSYSDGKIIDLTKEVIWTTSDASLLSISNAINFEGSSISKNAGLVIVNATLENFSASSNMSITDEILEKIDITLHRQSMAKGTTLSLVATGIYSDNSTLDITELVSWTSDDPAIVHINNQSNKPGLVTGLNLGKINIYAKLDNISSQAEISVTDASLIDISIKNLEPEVIKDTILSLEAIGIFSDGSKQIITNEVLWSSSENDITSISNNEFNSGNLQANQAGTSHISAKFDNIITGNSINVSDAIISKIMLESEASSIAKNTSSQLRAIGLLSNGDKQDITNLVSWKSESDDVIKIQNFKNNKGKISAISSGDVRLSASLNKISASLVMTVFDATLLSIEVSHQNQQTANNTKINLYATGVYSDGSRRDITQNVLWQSDEPDIVFVSNADNKNGFAYSISIGTASISANYDDVSGFTKISVNDKSLDAITILSQNSSSLVIGNKIQLIAIGNYSDGSTLEFINQITWQSSDNSTCTISNNEASFGILLAKKSGTCRITAGFGEMSGSLVFSIKDATLESINITPSSLTLAKGTQARLVATGNYSDNTSLDISRQVTWTSDNEFVRIDGGYVNAIDAGESTITAQYQDISNNSKINVTAATLQNITISQTVDGDFIKGTVKSFSALGTYSDQSSQDISSQVLWISSDFTVVSTNNTDKTKQQITSIKAGNTLLTATFDSITSNALNLVIIDDPLAPVSLSLKASPYIILNDGVDISNVVVTVQASDDQQNVLDNTEIELRIINGEGSLNDSSIMTIDGKASLDYSSTIKGLITIEASIKGTEIVNYILIYITDDFSEIIGRYGFASGNLENDLVAIDSQFGFQIINFANRPFILDGYRVFNENNIIVETDDSTILNNNLLPAGGIVSIIYTATQALSNNYYAAYYLTEPKTGQQFSIVGVFTLK